MSTISATIVKDHRKLAEYYNEVVQSKDYDHKERFGNQFTRELARHVVAEDLVVYPAFKKYLGAEGREMAEGDRKDHHEIKKLLKSFQTMKPQNANYTSRIQGIWATFSQHVLDEEEKHLPALEDALKLEGNASESLAKQFRRIKALAPTRSHPIAGERRPLGAVLGLFMGLVDCLADCFRKFPEGTK